ncbi:MAG TPA: hypothetical protein VFN10_23795, partial [Thermoanaerobaculia bacterium]|nr:hypothetical protein [Thermoanaerobaculia bacterium]
AWGGAKGRYIFTEQGGWIDLRHLFRLAWVAKTRHGKMISADLAGVLIEEDQAEKGHPSAFTYEDLSTNSLGVQLGMQLLTRSDPAAVIGKFISDLAPSDTYEDPDALTGILNFSTDPVLSANDPTLRVAGRWRYKPSGNPYKDKYWLSLMNEGYARNPSRGEVRTTDESQLGLTEVWRLLMNDHRRTGPPWQPPKPKTQPRKIDPLTTWIERHR